MLLKKYVSEYVNDPDSKIQCGMALKTLEDMSRDTDFQPPPHNQIWSLKKWMELRNHIDLAFNKIFVVKNDLDVNAGNLGLLVVSSVDVTTMEIWFTSEITGLVGETDVIEINDKVGISSYLTHGSNVESTGNICKTHWGGVMSCKDNRYKKWVIGRLDGSLKYELYVDRADIYLIGEMIHNRFDPSILYNQYIKTI